MSAMNDEENMQNDVKKDNLKIQRKPEGEIAYVLLALGLILLAISLTHSNNISAFIGIALTFWGSLFLYVKPTRYIRKDILETSIQDYVSDIENFLNVLNFKGSPRYVSPGTLTGLRKVVVVITESERSQMPSDEQLSTDDFLIENPAAVAMKPPGSELIKLFEKELKINFSSITIPYLLDNLEKILVEGFEIAKKFNIEYSESSSIFKIKMSETIFDKNIEQIIDKNVSKHIGDPLISSIACILSLATHKIIHIKNVETNQISKETNVTYEIHARE